MTNREPIRLVSETDNFARRTQEALRTGGGGPYDGGMEQRVRQLETDMSFIKGKLEDMPTKDWLTDKIAGGLASLEAKMLTKWDVALVVGLVIAAFMAVSAWGPPAIEMLSKKP